MSQYLELSPRFILQMESLRGLSAIIVLFSHCYQLFIGPVDQEYYPFFRLLGQSAVMMFFALSGYLIGHSIQKNIQINTQFSIKQYFTQRAKRILPPFLFSLILVVFLYYLAPYVFQSGTRDILSTHSFMLRKNYDVNLSDFIGSMFFVNGFITGNISANAPLWSLSYEVWFYVLAGFIPFLRSSLIAIAGFLVVLICLTVLNFKFLTYFLVWIFAFILSFPHYIKSIQSQQLNVLKNLCIIIAGLIAIYDFYQFNHFYLRKIYTAENFVYFNFFIGISFAIWLTQLRRETHSFKPIFIQSADFSYTLYITHFPLLIFIAGCFPFIISESIWVNLLYLVMTMLLLIGFSWGIARYLEPQRRVKTH